mmetsp:Transcript_1246/g.1893  ORF Transcript_1246/g.1893 Transcript_1246/m.1893 type:complete len:116 (-) Transcript_1246:341-688(-)
MWIEEWCRKYDAAGTGNTALLLLDPTKSAYQAWSIPSSNVAAFGLANTWYYVKAFFCRGKRSISIKGESGQLGADFVVAPGGTLLSKHYCKNPTDRVDVNTLLEKIRLFRTCRYV